MEKKLIIFIIILFILVIFFFPRYCGNWGTAAPNSGAVYQDCTCIGIKHIPFQGQGGGRIICYGIPISYECYEIKWSEENGLYKEIVPCE